MEEFILVKRSDLQLMVQVSDAINRRILNDYDMELITATSMAQYEQKCPRCSFMIMMNTPIVNAKRKNGTGGEWIHRVCPTVKIVH